MRQGGGGTRRRAGRPPVGRAADGLQGCAGLQRQGQLAGRQVVARLYVARERRRRAADADEDDERAKALRRRAL